MKNLMIAAASAGLFGCTAPAPVQTEVFSPAVVAPTPEPRSYFDLQEAAKAATGAGEWQQCIELYEQAAAVTKFTTNQLGSYYNAACCAASAGNVDEAFRLLDQAVAAGFENATHLAEDSDLASLHADARWVPLQEKLSAAAVQRRITRNSELVDVYRADQADRQSENSTDIFERDRERRQQVTAILEAGGAKIAEDYYHAAMVFQHGNELVDIERAHELAAMGLELDPTNGQIAWLFAASLDRALMRKGEPQRYTTQFTLDPKTETWVLYSWDPTVTDAERAAVNVPPLRVAQERAAQMNAEASTTP